MYNLVKIDEFLRPDHKYLEPDDECFYFMEYIPIKRLYNAENNLMMNFKKEMDRKGRPEWKYKGIAIRRVADIFDQSYLNLTSQIQYSFPFPLQGLRGTRCMTIE
jgi:hypothetical protein